MEETGSERGVKSKHLVDFHSTRIFPGFFQLAGGVFLAILRRFIIISNTSTLALSHNARINKGLLVLGVGD
jgi:hypothetical protein